jgi:DNA-binding transcriptional ArsR family regulator
MAKLFPFKPTDNLPGEGPPRILNIRDDDATDVLGALSSETARDILSTLYDEPTTASELADAVDTSIQNTRYHLEKLQEAELIEPVDTWYSSRGTEMTVYAPTNEPLVLAAGPPDRTSAIKDVLSNVIGALGILAIVSLILDRGIRYFFDPPTVGGTTENTEQVGTMTTADQAPQTTPETAPPDWGLFELLTIDVTPGVLIFAGGLVLLGFVVIWWYYSSYRPTFKPA